MSEYAVVNPATGQQLQSYETISDLALEDAVSRAHNAFRDWSRNTTREQRAKILGRVADTYVARREELAQIIVREMGKPLAQSLGEVDVCVQIYRYYAERIADMLKDEPIEPLNGAGEAFVRRTPTGLLLGIMPWNFPYYQVARFAGPNLAAGNTVLLKHAPQCPQSAAAIEEIFHAAGIPQDAYINIYASHAQIASVIADPRLQGVSLTGSGRAGAQVAALAGRHLKKVVLELGGSNPFVVLKTDDLDAVVETAVGARTRNAGQVCAAAKRFIIAAEYYDDFVKKFGDALARIEPGDPTSPQTSMGPLSSSAAADRLQAQIDQAIAHGANLVTSGDRNGNFVRAGLLTDVTRDNPVYNDELFGPIAQVFRASSEAEAIEIANDTPYGLGAFVFTTDPEQAMRVSDEIEAGNVFVNAVGPASPELPLGGVKASGFGRELGRYGVEEFLNKKTIRIP
jgi:succinate-semialdehyde dehydrogenase / glutarate-semialdehyde dehydrogenase